jgi:hypothetical protein
MTEAAPVNGFRQRPRYALREFARVYRAIARSQTCERVSPVFFFFFHAFSGRCAPRRVVLSLLVWSGLRKPNIVFLFFYCLAFFPGMYIINLLPRARRCWFCCMSAEAEAVGCGCF